MRRIKTAISIVAMLLAISIGVAATTDNASGRRPLQTKGTPTSGLFRTAANQSMRLDRRRTPAQAAAARKFLATEVSYYTSLCEVTLSSPMVYTNLQSNIHADAGGALVDDTYYCIEQVSGSIFTISAYNADTWEQKSSTIVYGYDFFAHDLTYDPVDRKIYGCFMKTTEDGDTDGFVWGWLDTENLQRVAIADMPKSVAAVASTPEGVIYAIDYEGELSTVDKTNGHLTKIADTGLKSELATGGVIDPKTGILYYVTQTNADIPKVYAVNVTDGTSTAVGDLTEYQQLRGMFFPAPKASDNAPAAVSKIDMQIMGEALMGMAVITMPAETYAGDTMYGQLSYTVYINGEQFSTGTSYAGDMQYEFLEFPEPGMYTIGVTVSNENGTSPLYEISKWIGLDELNALRKVNMTEEDGNVQLSWAAASSVHGGYFNPELVTYDVTRLPDEKKIASDITATDCTDVIEKGETLKSTKWRVDLKYDGQVKSSAISAVVVSGSVAEVPFRTSFETKDEFSFFTVIDSNQDNMKWSWLDFYDLNQCAGLKSHETNAGDDWLITPGIRMKAGTKYKVSFIPSCYLPWCPERLEVKWGTAATAEAMTTELVAPMVVDKTKSDAVKVTAIFEPENDGIYYFGFHGISDPYEYYLAVDDIAITVSDGKAPALATELTATPDASGASSAEISFMTPVLTENGTDLAELSLVELRRDGQLIKSWENPGMGVRLNHTDTDETLSGASHTYTVVCSNGSGESAPASVRVYVGEDYPDRVLNIMAKENPDGSVSITWDCPEQGENGGYINPENVTYTVSRLYAADGRIQTLASTSETTYTDNFNENAGQQTVLSYIVRPQNEVGIGRWADSETLILGGTSIKYPFKESVPAGYASNALWGSENHKTNGAWFIAERGVAPVCSPQDNDGGMFEFVQEAVGDKSRLTSGRIDASSAKNPVLTFWYYAAGNNLLSVQVNPDNSGWQTLQTIDLAERQAEGWTKVRVNLSDLGAKRSFRLGFLGEAKDADTSIYIDNIQLYDTHPVNLGIAASTFPAEVITGNDMTAVLTVENTGSETAANGKISLTRNGVTVGEFDISTLEPEATTTVEVSEHVDASFPSRATYIATLLIDGDGDDSDNYAASTIEFMYGYDLPAPVNLQGELKDNDAVLSWEAPTAYRGSEDGFENYEPFGFLQAIGPWRSIDGNGTGKITPVDGDRQVDIPTAGLAVGFQIFDSKEAKMESRDLDARSGTRAMVTFADKQGANNDWLISPEIKGGTKVTLYAKAGSQYFKENFEVLYSASDRNRESFRAIGETRNVGSDWTEIRFTLPQDARYFAIRYCSFNCYALLIDDISYTTNAGEAELIGYNVYRDGEFLAGTDKDVTSHTDAGGKNHTYTVTALYDRGESLMTMPVVISGSGVEGITGYGVTVKAEAGILHVSGAEGLSMRIWRADGTAVDARTCGAVETIPLPPGIYIITIGDRVLKTVVN